MEPGWIRTTLSNAPSAPTSLETLRHWASRAWRERGIAILWPDQIHNEFDRQLIANIAEALYGTKKP